jgi:hypothetical protein
MKPTFFKGVVLGAVIAAVVSAGTVAFGAVTPFNLNTTANTVTAPTRASGSIAGNQFTLTDNSTAAGAPLALTNNSTATGATALKLTVKPGKAPFNVNSGTKVANLNADKLDGIDSTALIQGKGRTYTLAVAVSRFVGDATHVYTPSPAVAPGFFNVGLECPGTTNNTSPPVLEFSNASGSDENLFFRNDLYPDTIEGTMPGTGQIFHVDTSGPDLTTATINGVPGGVETTSSIQIGTVTHSDNCYFQIQALTTQQ